MSEPYRRGLAVGPKGVDALLHLSQVAGAEEAAAMHSAQGSSDGGRADDRGRDGGAPAGRGVAWFVVGSVDAHEWFRPDARHLAGEERRLAG